jgi:hypothetical protein
MNVTLQVDYRVSTFGSEITYIQMLLLNGTGTYICIGARSETASDSQ